MANVDKIKNDIKNLKAAIKNPKTPTKFLPNLKQQLQKAQIQLDATKKPIQKVAVKSATSSVAYKRAIELAKKYRLHQTGVPKGKSDIEKDADRPAMPTGRRISQGLRANKSGSKKSNKGNVYYEYRENRIDRKQPPKRYPKLEMGGSTNNFKGNIKGGDVFEIDWDGKSKVIVNKVTNAKGDNGEDIKLIAIYRLRDTQQDFIVLPEDEFVKMAHKKLEGGGMMAMGGITQHGLKVEDCIVGVSEDGVRIYIQNKENHRKNEHSYWEVNLEEGTRIKWDGLMPKMEHGGKTHGSSVNMGHIKSTEHRLK